MLIINKWGNLGFKSECYVYFRKWKSDSSIQNKNWFRIFKIWVHIQIPQPQFSFANLYKISLCSHGPSLDPKVWAQIFNALYTIL